MMTGRIYILSPSCSIVPLVVSPMGSSTVTTVINFHQKNYYILVVLYDEEQLVLGSEQYCVGFPPASTKVA
jgi:hypothetical protein